MKTHLLRPGYMIALSSRLKGGTMYELNEGETTMDGVMLTKRRESTTTVFDKQEHDEATRVRGAALYAIRRLTVKTPFSLLCPEENIAALEAGIEAAKAMVDTFNATSTFSKVSLYVLKARLMGDDESTAKAVAEEMSQLISDMSRAIEKLDPVAIREALTKADEVSQMFATEQQEAVSTAIALARAAAREITKSVKKKGSVAQATASDFRAALDAAETARRVFLDFSEPTPMSVSQEAPGVVVKDLDFSDSPAEVQALPVYTDNVLDLSV